MRIANLEGFIFKYWGLHIFVEVYTSFDGRSILLSRLTASWKLSIVCYCTQSNSDSGLTSIDQHVCLARPTVSIYMSPRHI
jgi:hypothetical protein